MSEASRTGEGDYTDLPVGEILRRARVHYGQSLQDVERMIRIRAIQLDAIEKGENEKLPGRVYAIGFVRAYSEYLGLDGERMVALFKKQAAIATSRPELQFPAPASESRLPGGAFIVWSLTGAVLIICAWVIFFAPKQVTETIPPVPETLKKAEITEAPPLTVAPEEAAPAEETKPENRVILTITENAWVEIRDGAGTALISRILKPGDIYLVPDTPGLVLATGNAGGIVVSIDGKDIGPIGAPASVMRNVPLGAEDLLKSVEKTP